MCTTPTRPRAGSIALVAILAWVAFAPALRNGFVFDDHWLVERNPVVRTLDLRQHFASPFWSRWEKVDPYYRPLVTASVAVDRALWGEAPLPFHATNLLLHAAVSIALLFLFGRVGSPRGALAGAALFAIHPLQSEAVVWIMGRTDLMAALFCLCAAAVHARVAALDQPSSGRTAAIASLFAAALLSKETALALPAILIAVDVAVARRAGLSSAATKRVVFARLVRHLAIFVPLVAAWLVTRWLVTGTLLGTGDDPDAIWNNPIHGQSIPGRWWTAVHVAGRYLGLIVWPASLSADYRYDVVRGVESPLDPSFVLPFVGLLAVLGAAVVLARRSPLATFGLLAGLGAYLPVSHLVIAAPVILAERFFYLPFAGVAALAGAAFDRVSGRRPAWLAPGLGLSLAALLVYVSWTRTQEWVDDRTLFAATVASQPRSVLGWNNLGSELAKSGDLEGGLAAFDRALAIRPRDLSARLNRAVLLGQRGEYERAAAELRSAAVDFPNSGKLRLHLAETELNAASRLAARGLDADARRLREGVVSRASADAERALAEGGPGVHAAFLVQVGRAWSALGRLADAERAFELARSEVAREELEGGAVPEAVAGVRCRVQAAAAQMYVEHGRPAEAASRWSDAADGAEQARQPSLAASFRLEAARALWSAGRPADAEENAQRAVDGLPPEDQRAGEARELLARLLAYRGETTRARRLATDDRTRLSAAEGALEGGRPADALALYDELVAGGDQARVLSGRGRAHLALGQLAEAERDLSRAVALARAGRALAAAWCDLARVSLARGEVERAIARLDRAIEAEPGYSEAYYRRGQAELGRGHENDGEVDLERALAAGLPRAIAVEVGLTLADRAARRGDLRQVRQRLNAVLAVDPGNARARDWVGRLPG